jgi:hypothetical protein
MDEKGEIFLFLYTREANELDLSRALFFLL